MKKVTKVILRITAKRHAHLQTLTKTPAKLIKDPAKTVKGVAFRRFCDGLMDRETDAQGNKICLRDIIFEKVHPEKSQQTKTKA